MNRLQRSTLAQLIGLSIVALVSSPLPTSQAATTAGGDFIIKCLNTGKVAAADPIVSPGKESAHFHLFFGNTITPTSTLTNEGPDGTTGVEGNPGTTCADPQDTSLMWTPDFWRCVYAGVGVPPTTCKEFLTGGANQTALTSRAIDLRAYYIADYGQARMNFLPDGAALVQGNTMDRRADGTTQTSPFQFPQNLMTSPDGSEISDFDCGAGGGPPNNPAPTTPQSPWPYNCNLVAPYCGLVQSHCGWGTEPTFCVNYPNQCSSVTYGNATWTKKTWWYQKGYCAPNAWMCTSDTNANVTLDGMVERIFMPDCWDGKLQGSANINGDQLPGFITQSSTVRDFAYKQADGTCLSPGFQYQVPQVSPRVHWMISDPMIGSSYANDKTTGQPTVTPASKFIGFPLCGVQLQDDSGAPCVKPSTDFPGKPVPNAYDYSIWLGPMTSAGAAAEGMSNLTCPDTRPSSPLSSGYDACLMGLSAEHVDYWNTWQQPQSCDALKPLPGGNVESSGDTAINGNTTCANHVEDGNSAYSTLDDLTEDCLNAIGPSPDQNDSMQCGFIGAPPNNSDGR